ncbi:MAG: hypothetical protein LQ349_008157 [Xanthoria aureola]|nr:MAG: hypothetical protein LQ349_008157 [Xanthoria aureola]
MPKLDAGGVANVAAAIVFVVVVVDSLAVFLRMLAKSRTKYYFSNDDYWILAALLCFFAWAGPILYAIFGLAGSLDVATRTDVGDVQQVLKVSHPSLAVRVEIAKEPKVPLSVLCFYRTIFSTRNFRLITHAVSAVCVMWMLATCWVIVFQCRPIRAVYNTSLAATADCVSFAWFVFTSELTNALIDVCILALPIYMVLSYR